MLLCKESWKLDMRCFFEHALQQVHQLVSCRSVGFFTISWRDGPSSLAFSDCSFPDASGDESSQTVHRYDLPFPFYVEECVSSDSSYDVQFLTAILVTRLIHRSQGYFAGKSTDACRFGFRDPCWNSLLAHSFDLESNNSSNNKDKRQLLDDLYDWKKMVIFQGIQFGGLTLKAQGSGNLV